MLRRLWPTLMRSLRSPISWRFQSRAAGLRRGHDLQCAPPQRRCRGDVVTILGIGGLGLSWGAVRKQPRLPHRRDHAAPTRRRSPQARRALLHRQRDRRRDGGIQPFRRCGNPGDWQVWEVRSRLASTSEGGRNPFSACSRLSVSASALPMLPAPLWTSGPRKSGQAPVARD